MMSSRTILDSSPVQQAGVIRPGHAYILTANGALSFAEFSVRVEVFRHRLGSLPQNRPVLVAMQRTPEHLALLFAVMESGRLAVPVDGDTPEARQQDLIAQLDATHWLTPEIVLSQPANNLSDGFDAEKPCLGIMTSGSTGNVKLVVHCWRTLLANAVGSNQILPLADDDRTLQSLPLYHIGGLQQCLRALISTTTLVIDGVVQDPDQLAAWQITHASMVATQLQRLLIAEQKLPHLKGVLLGGGPCPVDVIDRARALEYPILPTYGMSETAAQLMTLTDDGVQVLPGDEVKISTEGELCVRGESLLLGYWRNGALASALDADGWFHSGDLLQISEMGFTVVGRRDNRFTSGGHNVQPEEIETVLTRVAGIELAVVVPVAHAEFGLVPFAFVRCNEKLTESWQAQLVASLKQRLAGYLVPRHFAELPQISTLKPRRRDLQLLADQLLTEEVK